MIHGPVIASSFSGYDIARPGQVSLARSDDEKADSSHDTNQGQDGTDFVRANIDYISSLSFEHDFKTPPFTPPPTPPSHHPTNYSALSEVRVRTKKKKRKKSNGIQQGDPAPNAIKPSKRAWQMISREEQLGYDTIRIHCVWRGEGRGRHGLMDYFARSPSETEVPGGGLVI